MDIIISYLYEYNQYGIFVAVYFDTGKNKAVTCKIS